jgi:hypothetical protein
MLPQFYNYCQSEETMGGMRWLSRSVRSLMAACLEGDRQAGQGILCLGLLYVLSDLVVGDAIRQLRSSLPPAFTSSHHPHPSMIIDIDINLVGNSLLVVDPTRSNRKLTQRAVRKRVNAPRSDRRVGVQTILSYLFWIRNSTAELENCP